MNTPAGATSFYPQPFPESVQTAPIILRGKAGVSYSDWSKDDSGGKRIYTFYELQPTEVLKGNVSASSPLTLRELGGEKDGVGLNVPGVSQFEKGEDAVVFLKEKNSGGSYDVQGMMMGKYNIQKDSEGTEYLTGMGLNTFKNYSDNNGNNSGNSSDSASGSPSPKRWTLTALRELIRAQADPESHTEIDADTGKRRQDPNQKTKSPSPQTTLTPVSPTPLQEPSPSTLSQTATPTPLIEASDNTDPDFSKLSLLLLTLAGALGVWRYHRARQKK